MALTGTLKDFGIAEILQLIGQQAKSGVLHLASADEEIHVVLSDGAVVSAESARRKQKERLGAMLVRAELLSREALARALQVQGRTLRRLGDILVELELVTKQDLKEVTTLQTTETIYRLFEWKSGTYDFEPGAVEFDAGTVVPMRAEALLMEGFRRVDEWPMVRRKISSPAMTFLRRAPLPADESAGPAERRVHALAEPGRTVEKLVDLSRLGEFETCKALLTLVNMGCLKAVPAPRRSAAAGVGAYARSWRQRLRRGAAGLAATALLSGALAGGAWLAAERHRATVHAGPSLEEGAAQRLLARHQLARLAGALEVWRLERGSYPQRLAELVEADLAAPADLRWPWREEYHYRRTPDGGFVLLPPLP
ncbi:DUF4388 domain-containing protein [Anaeromyxobacter diazotrophicus]|uniref:PatA-like N-terminal domain-containing protein n=1 Tax=Anaeromyxobacter diazotrophicus TaxID=2590199 RepID=A0A7I9VIG5_9BACT|nr:DUF4388 domain-containing protein [Anaeromyxobacter diazotrophicus]GEJ56194.1 hypothetical protein AMYX_09350 [Anaeromyxobacter diazotrophicus]